MPVSADATGWKVYGTSQPNRWVAVHRGQYFHLSNRVGGGEGWDFMSLDGVMDQLKTLESGGTLMRVRGVWLDDAKGGGYTWFVDCMVPAGLPLPSSAELEEALNDGVARDDGQFHSFDIIARRIELNRDHFDLNHYDYYRRLPSYV